MDISETDDPTLVGEECHIVGRSADGPRGDSPLTMKQRDLYANRVLMCREHHKVVDDNEAEYPVDRLHELKTNHEAWVRKSLATYDAARQRDEELYATTVDEWQRRAELDDWEGWASSLVCHGQPRLGVEHVDRLAGLNDWLFRRVWPQRYTELEAGFENFRRVLNDLLKNFRDYGHEVGPEGRKVLEVEKRYQNLNRWDEDAYERLRREFEFAVGVVEDLALELTRAANLVCDLARRHLLPNYRLEQGLVVITAGPFTDLDFTTFRPRYSPGTKPVTAYEGLEGFLVAREHRDVSFGSGKGPEDQKG